MPELNSKGELNPEGGARLAEKELGIDPEKLWQAADKLRGSIDAAEYKHVVLGLIFLKYVSDAFEARRAALKAELKADGFTGDSLERQLEDRDEYTAENVFWVPKEARWPSLQDHHRSNDAMPARLLSTPLRRRISRRGPVFRPARSVSRRCRDYAFIKFRVLIRHAHSPGRCCIRARFRTKRCLPTPRLR